MHFAARICSFAARNLQILHRKRFFLDSSPFLFLVMVRVPGNTKNGAQFRRILTMDFEQLAADYSNMIHSIIHSLRIYKNHDEFYQIGLIALWEGSQHYDEQKGVFAPYIYKFIKGKLLTALKKEKKRDDRHVYPENEDEFHLGHEDRVLELEDLLSHFHHLTDLQKKWVVLRFYHGFSNRDIAEMENISLRKVRAWGDLAMKKFLKD